MAGSDDPPASVGHWGRVVSHGYDKIAGPIADAKRAHVAGIMEEIEADLTAAVAPILGQALANPDLPEEARALFGSIVEPQHFGQSFLVGMALGAVLNPVIGTALAPYVQGLANVVWPKNPVVPLSPVELATSVLKGVKSEPEAAGEALVSGVDAANFHALVMNAGNAIGIMEALLLWRRGQISEADLDRVIRYSNIRPDFGPMVKMLRYAPMSVGQAVEGAVQNHLTQTEARARIAVAGADPDDFDVLYANAGRPPGIQEMNHLVNRGVITDATFRQAVRESNIKDKYIDALAAMRVYVPPVRSVMPMLRAGAISDADAATLLRENGVRDSDIPRYLAEAHHAKTAVVKDLTQAQVIRLYTAHNITRAEATARLTALALTPTAITLLLDFADEQQRERFTNAIVTRIHARFTAYKITEAEAVSALAADGIASELIADLLKLWKIEREANMHVLTPSAVVGAYRRTWIKAAECKARLLALGVQHEDLGIIVSLGWPPTAPNPGAVQAVLDA